jgi:C-terminal processing protease CtpA/Prc
MPLWESPGARVECSQLTTPSRTCGLLEEAPGDPLDGVETRAMIWSPLRYRFEAGLHDGPLWVVVDEGTASASEGFVSTLQASGAATIVGGTTYGAGCGYVNGGIPLALEHAGLLVRMPNCVRYRADGANELEGIAPDVRAWSPEEGWAARTRGLIEALRRGQPRPPIGPSSGEPSS